MKRIVLLAVLGGMVMSAAPSWAHHSFAAEFDEKQPITLKGTLTKMEWVNPHGWIHMDVVNADGKVENWDVEAGAPNALLRRGLRKENFPPGSQIVVQGYRAKNGTRTVNGRTVTTTDGKNFFMGSSGGPGDTGEAR